MHDGLTQSDFLYPCSEQEASPRPPCDLQGSLLPTITCSERVRHACQFSRPCSELEASPRPPCDLLDSLLLASDEDGQGMADQALRDEVLTLLVAGVCCWARRCVGYVCAREVLVRAWPTKRCAMPPLMRCQVGTPAPAPTWPAPVQAAPQLASCHLVSVLPCAGQETSAILLGWACAYLAHTPMHCYSLGLIMCHIK